MSYVFFLDPYDNLLLHPDAVRLCEELRVLNDKEVAALIYAYDYHSMYRQFTLAERMRRASIKVYGDVKDKLFESPKMKAAIDAYMGIQYNPKIEFISTCQERIDGLQDDLRVAKDEKDISRILKSIKMLREQINELEKEVSEDTIKEGKVFGDASLSFIEMFQKNRAYKNLLDNKKK